MADDREALLLRFFKNSDFQSIGHALGLSDDAAQKRVSRALQKLRTYLSSRGVVATATALSSVLSVNAVMPDARRCGCHAFGDRAGRNSYCHQRHCNSYSRFLMTTLQKTLIGVTLAIVAGAGIYEAHKASQLHDQIETFRQQQAPLLEQMGQLREQRDAANGKFLAMQK